MMLFQLRNPWGGHVWTGDYSIDSSLWTPELEKVLHEKPKDGSFWMLGRDFFEHFTHIDVSKPIDAHWFVRRFTFKPKTAEDATKSSLDKHKNFVFQLIQKVPDGKKARVRILVEKRNT